MKKPNYRVCYENGHVVKGKEIYELHKTCNCEGCKNRGRMTRFPKNAATATTKDFDKINEAAEFLEKWNCDDGSRRLPIAYFKF